MRSKWIIRIWLGRLTRYLVVPLVFCVILFPLYGLMHQQTEKAQLTDAAEQLAHGRGVADYASFNALSEPRAAHNAAFTPAAIDAVFAGHVSRFVVVRYFHPQ